MRDWSTGRRLSLLLGLVLLMRSASQFSLSPSWWYGLGLTLGLGIVATACAPRVWR